MSQAASYIDYFSDHLGSHGVVENATGSSCEQDIDYFPYGGVTNDYCGTIAQHYRFTGKERDTESGLDHFGARHESSALGRFMQPDSIGIMKEKFADPQQWNLYAYTRNSSLTRIDGRQVLCPRSSGRTGRNMCRFLYQRKEVRLRESGLWG
jgi:RHS repeat-associated protein